MYIVHVYTCAVQVCVVLNISFSIPFFYLPPPPSSLPHPSPPLLITNTTITHVTSVS